MQNAKFTVNGSKLVIEVDLSADLGPSATGKSRMVASTHGNVVIPGTDVTIGVNAYRRVQKAA
jgi:hypothetical protein